MIEESKLSHESIEEIKKKGNLVINLCMATHEKFDPTIVTGFVQKELADTWVKKVSLLLAKAYKEGEISVVSFNELKELGLPHVDAIRISGMGNLVNKEFINDFEIYQAELMIEDLKID